MNHHQKNSSSLNFFITQNVIIGTIEFEQNKNPRKWKKTTLEKERERERARRKKPSNAWELKKSSLIKLQGGVGVLVLTYTSKDLAIAR
jgi:hypothetical protein